MSTEPSAGSEMRTDCVDGSIVDAASADRLNGGTYGVVRDDVGSLDCICAGRRDGEIAADNLECGIAAPEEA